MSTKTKVQTVTVSASGTALVFPLNGYPAQQHFSTQVIESSAGVAECHFQVTLEDSSASTNWFDIEDTTGASYFQTHNFVAKNARLLVDAASAAGTDTLVAHMLQSGV